MSAQGANGGEKTALAPAAVAAMGVVFGDIGTSPLYTIKEVFGGHHPVPVTPDNVLGILSLVFWALTITVSLKYVLFITRADNRGEGGIMALTSLALRTANAEPRLLWLLSVLGIFGAALFYGDAVITPAMSVLAAVEGLEVATPVAKPYVVPITIGILIGLFLFQRHGTAAVGALFGPVMMFWFATLGALGLWNVFKHPDVLLAINPWYAFEFFFEHGSLAFLALGAVVLAITGGEALYADMGHFGRLPIRLTWYAMVLPSLALNYFGQGAYLLQNPDMTNINPFFALAAKPLLYPLVALATFATIIASQAMISGVYSLTQQAIQLGFTPRMRIIHTSEMAKGQIYIPTVNWLVMIACLTLVLVFKESSRLAAAYGFAVTASMTITSLIYFQVTQIKWNWPLWRSIVLVSIFLLFDGSFLSANILKVVDGGWVTISIAALVLTSMITWRDGRALLAKHYELMRMPAEVFLKDLAKYSPQRTAGTAVFMSIHPEGIPNTLLHHLKHNEALHERVLMLSIISAETPTVPPEEQVTLEHMGHGFYRVKAFYGFMESPDMPKILDLLGKKGLEIDIYTTSFFLSRENLLPTGNAPMAQWRKHLFILMSRNSWNATSFFKLPPERVVELGSQVEL